MYIGFRDSHRGRRRPLSLSSGWALSLLSLPLRLQQSRPDLCPCNVLLFRGRAVSGIVRAAAGPLSQTVVLALLRTTLRSFTGGWADDGKAQMWSKLSPDTRAVAGVSIVMCLLSNGPSAAPTAELAKKCAALTAKVFPARVAGNPAAGSAKGSGRTEQEYFNDCIKRGGNVDPPSPSEGTSPIPIPVPRP
jgi:hypothetical protein